MAPSLLPQACIGGYWASSRVCSCPLCKRQFDERPLLNINRVFALIADKYKHSRYGTPLQKGLPTAAGGHEEQAGTCAYAATNPFAPPDPGALVNCDICTGVKRAAVSSCLVCTAAYCDEHVQPHLTSAFYASHSLLDPQEALRGRTCVEHKHLLEVRTDRDNGAPREVTRQKRSVPMMQSAWVLVLNAIEALCSSLGGAKPSQNVKLLT